jgi:segregation and condensation protein B
MATIKDGIVEMNSPEIEPDDSRKDDESIKGLLEAVLFLSNEPVPLSFFVNSFSIDPTQAKIILDSLVDEYGDRDGGIILLEVAKGYQFVTNTRYAEQLRRVIGVRKREALSKGMLETLAIIAYKQPIVLAEIDELRGVSSRMMVVKLMDRNLVKPVGRKEVPGRPLSYGTTNEFLRYFGLNKLSDLPKLSEIKEFSLNWDE